MPKCDSSNVTFSFQPNRFAKCYKTRILVTTGYISGYMMSLVLQVQTQQILTRNRAEPA